MNKIIVLFVFMGVVTSGCMAADRDKGVRRLNELAALAAVPAHKNDRTPIEDNTGALDEKSREDIVDVKRELAARLGENFLKAFRHDLFPAEDLVGSSSGDFFLQYEALCAIFNNFGDAGLERVGNIENGLHGAISTSLQEFRRHPASWISEGPHRSITACTLVVNSFIDASLKDSTWRLCSPIPKDASCLKGLIASIKNRALGGHWVDVCENALKVEIVAADLRKKLLSAGSVYQELAALCEIREKLKDSSGLERLSYVGSPDVLSWITQPNDIAGSVQILDDFFRRMTRLIYNKKISSEQMECLRNLLNDFEKMVEQITMTGSTRKEHFLNQIGVYKGLLDANAALPDVRG